MKTDPEIERVAKALVEMGHETFMDVCAWCIMPEYERERWRKIAQAAIAAIAEKQK